MNGDWDMKNTLLVLTVLCWMYPCGAQGVVDPNVLERAGELMKQDDSDGAMDLLAELRDQSDTPWLVTQEMGKLLFYDLQKGVSVFAEDKRGEVFSANADRAVALFEEAIAENPEQTYDARKLLAYLLFDREQHDRAAEVLSEGLTYFGDDEDYTRQYHHLNEKMAVKRLRGWVYGTAMLLTLLIGYRIYTTYRVPKLAQDFTEGTIPTDHEIVLESTMKNTKWGLLILGCAWCIIGVLGPSSLAACLYSQSLSDRLMEGFMVACGLFFFCSAFLFFGKKVLTFQANGNVVLREVGLMGRNIDWQVLAKDLAGVKTEEAYAYFYVYAVPRTIACTHVLLVDRAGRSYPVLRTPDKQDALALAETIGRTVNVPITD